MRSKIAWCTKQEKLFALKCFYYDNSTRKNFEIPRMPQLRYNNNILSSYFHQYSLQKCTFSSFLSFFIYLQIPKTHYYVVWSVLGALVWAVVPKHSQQCTFFYFVAVNLIFPSSFVHKKRAMPAHKRPFLWGLVN